MEVANQEAGKKQKRLTSVVWDHFERVKKADIWYAVCVHCNKKLSGSSNSGTTHLRNHLLRCLKTTASDYDVSQLLSAKKRKKDNTVSIANVRFDEGKRKDESFKTALIAYEPEPRKDDFLNFTSGRFSQERTQHDLARMIILHGYPIAMVDHVGFKVFVKNLQPLFDVVPNSMVEFSCMEIYAKERQKVYEMLNKFHGRINVSVEKWCSLENSECLCLTAHYIGDDWKVEKKILNFVTLDSSHTEDMLSEEIIKYLCDWGVECKLFALTFDDCSIDNDIVLRIKDQISQSRPHFSYGELFDVRSSAHILYSFVQDAMEDLRVVIQKIRGSIRYVKSTQATKEKFSEISQLAGIEEEKSLVLDSPLRWNSTVLMLETAVEYRNIFCQLPELGSEFALTDEEWEWASSITSYLKMFVDVINVFSRDRSPTANIYFPEVCEVHIKLIEWGKIRDEFLLSVVAKMKIKFDQYWSKCSLALAIAAILDPRYKMKLVEYYFGQIYGSTAQNRTKEVSERLKELFNAYTICSTLIDQGSALPGSSLPSTDGSRDRLRGFEKFLHETSQSQNAISELEKYLEESIFTRSHEFDVLNWWRVHTPRFPILSMMARDVLGTPMSTHAQESAFNVGGRVLDSCRSLLSSETRQALICAHDWLQIQPNDIIPSSRLHPLSTYVEEN